MNPLRFVALVAFLLSTPNSAFSQSINPADYENITLRQMARPLP